MSYKISKELLRVVLNEAVLRLGSFNNPIIEIAVQRYSYREWLKINLHELQHKMKEWALKQGYELQSRLMSNDHIGIGNCLVIRAEPDPEEIQKIFNSDSEQQSVFDACQWILDNKDKQC